MALPVLHVTDIPEEGLRLACELQAEELVLAPTDGRFPSGLSLEVEFTRGDRGIRAAGVLSAVCVRQCVRCLKEYEDALSLPFAVEYRHEEKPARGPLRPAGGKSPRAAHVAVVEPDEDDVYPYGGESLELTEMLREQVILAAPMQPLCREDCPGLCAVCGQDLSEGACGCPEQREDSPFATQRRRAGMPEPG